MKNLIYILIYSNLFIRAILWKKKDKYKNIFNFMHKFTKKNLIKVLKNYAKA